jgi:hypothetical protein
MEGSLVDMDAQEEHGNNRSQDPLAPLLQLVRQDLVAMNRVGEGFHGIRSELVFQRVLAKIQEERQRRFSGLGILRVITATAAAMWNSRVLRMLMP